MPGLSDCAPSCCATPSPVNIVGPIGAAGATGPNIITAATATDQKGFLTADGANVGSLPMPLPVANGGTGAATQLAALSSILGGVPLPVANGGTGLSVAPTPHAAPVTSSPSDPNATTSATPVMMAVNISFTPAVTGNVLLLITGTASNAGGGGTSVTAIALYYGTGAASGYGSPVPGGAIQLGKTKNILTGSAGGKVGFAITKPAIGLTVATPYWFDLALTSDGANAAKVYDLDIVAIEI